MTINKEYQRICDFKCDCHSCWDEASCPWSGNLTRQDLLREEDRYRGMMEEYATSVEIARVTGTKGLALAAASKEQRVW